MTWPALHFVVVVVVSSTCDRDSCASFNAHFVYVVAVRFYYRHFIFSPSPSFIVRRVCVMGNKLGDDVTMIKRRCVQFAQNHVATVALNCCCCSLRLHFMIDAWCLVVIVCLVARCP